eukprot:Gb_22421 [translate_table: standard]
MKQNQNTLSRTELHLLKRWNLTEYISTAVIRSPTQKIHFKYPALVFDGASKPNPSIAFAGGILWSDPHSKILEFCTNLGHASNNVAEMICKLGLLLAGMFTRGTRPRQRITLPLMRRIRRRSSRPLRNYLRKAQAQKANKHLKKKKKWVDPEAIPKKWCKKAHLVGTKTGKALWVKETWRSRSNEVDSCQSEYETSASEDLDMYSCSDGDK